MKCSIDKLMFICVMCLTLQQTAEAQVHEKNDSIHQAFLKMKDHPSRYTSEEIVKVYEAEVMQEASKGLDTILLQFREMKSFGHALRDVVVVGMANMSIASIHKMMGKHDELVSLYMESIPLFEQHPKQQVQALKALANAYSVQNQLDSASYYIDVSMEKVLALNDSSLLADVYSTRGLLRSRQEKYYSAISDFLSAIAYGGDLYLPLKKCNNYNYIAKQYNNVNDLENAVKYNAIALQLAQENEYKGMASETSIAQGNYLVGMGKYALAKSYFEAALPYQLEGSGRAKGLITIYSKLAIIDLQSGNEKSAQERLFKAQQLLDADVSDLFKAPYHQALAYLYMEKKMFDQSIVHLNKFLSIAEQFGDAKNKQIGFATFKQLYARQHKWKEAYAYGDSMLNLTKQLDIENQKRFIIDMESKYAYELKETQINQLHSKSEIQLLQLEKKNRQLLYGGISLVLITMALYGFLQAYRTKNRSNAMLHDRNSQLIKALENNKMLVKEIHHRVKNNLQVVSSLLNLQSRFEQDDNVLKAINTGKYRVQSMSLLHQSLYLNEDLSSIHIKKYFEDLAKSIVKGYPLYGKEVQLKLDIEDLQLDVDTVVPLGLISNELITNALKYAYEEKDYCELIFSIKESDNLVRLIVKDNGVGISFTELPEKSNSMGMQLIKSFASKIKATVDIDNFKGTEFKFTFDKKRIKSHLNVVKHAAS